MLYDLTGPRKYLSSRERREFISTARGAPADVMTFALAMAFTGARILEILEMVPLRVDYSIQAVVIRTLKRRRPDIYRVIPVPEHFLELLDSVHHVRTKQADPELKNAHLWPWCRTTAWSKIKGLMLRAGISGVRATPKGLRHGLGVEGTAEAGIPLNVMQKWLGHARIETTAIYANAVGNEERALAGRIWQ